MKVQIADAQGRLKSIFEADTVIAGADIAFEQLRWGLGTAVIVDGHDVIAFGKIGDELVNLLTGQSYLPGCTTPWGECISCGTVSSSVRHHKTVAGTRAALCRGCFDLGEGAC